MYSFHVSHSFYVNISWYGKEEGERSREQYKNEIFSYLNSSGKEKEVKTFLFASCRYFVNYMNFEDKESESMFTFRN